MYYRILETDEAIDDLSHIAFNAYDYTRDVNSGIKFLALYDAVCSNMSVFPEGFRRTSIEYRDYEIHILPFVNYNLFYIINDDDKTITVLRVLYQKQNWQSILLGIVSYHVQGDEI